MYKVETIQDTQQALDDYLNYIEQKREKGRGDVSKYTNSKSVAPNLEELKKAKSVKKRNREKRNIEAVDVFREEPLKASRVDRKQALNILLVKKDKAVAVHSPIINEEEQEAKRNFKDEYVVRKQLKVPTYDPSKQSEQQYFLNRIFYDNHESETVVFQKQTKENPIIKHFKVNDLGNYVKYFSQKGEDLHVVLNSFIFKREDRRRSSENIHMINAFLVDVDYYNLGMSLEDVLEKIESIKTTLSIPDQTFTVNSGGGLYLIWKVTAVANNSNKMAYLYRLIQKELNKAFKEVGADPRAVDIARMLKIPGSINSKYKSKPEVAFIGEPSYERLDFFTFKELLIKDKPTVYKEKAPVSDDIKKKLKEKGLKSGKNAETLLQARKEDFLVVDKMKVTKEGYRYYMLFYLAFSLAGTKRSDSEILKELHRFNGQLKMPLDDSEVERLDFRKGSSYNQKWKFTNAEIIEKLEISEDMQQYLQTLIGKAEKQKRRVEQNNKYHNKKEEVIKKRKKKEERNILIQKLKAYGHSQKEVLKLMTEDYQRDDVSISTIKRWWNP